MNVLGRKTLSPLVTMILAKNGVEDGSDTRHAGQSLEYAVAGTAHRGEVGDGEGGNYPVVRESGSQESAGRSRDRLFSWQ